MAFNFSEAEQKTLEFWKERKIFEKSLEKTKDQKPFVFYDGPPFATGLPHYGHILSSVAKDIIPRYKTMRGFYVGRRWGWDCHGLPIENLVEKELGISGKKEIENEIGVEKFNALCRSKVLTYTHEWKKMVDRIGRFVDFDNSYKTMDSTYMESVWWMLKTLWEKGLVYEGKKVLMYCPHCETPVSKAEISMDNSYKDITEEAVTAKFKIKNPEKYNLKENIYLLAWTTTPWTLPGNVALAVGEKLSYAHVMFEGQDYIVAKDRVEDVFGHGQYEIEGEFTGKDLVGIEYEPLYEIAAVKNSGKKAWYVAPADFVNTDEGTGIVHTAVIYGEDDYNLGLKMDLPMIPLLNSKGVFNTDAPELTKGEYFKKSEKKIKEDLESRGLLFSKKDNTHSYPFCWRCGTQLFYNAISAWFINIQNHKQKIIKLNEKINWYPEHLKHGRFLNILEGAPDWNISRNRYWATPLPFFACECGNKMCVESVAELKEKAVNFNSVYSSDDINQMDLHKDKMDKIMVVCDKCGKHAGRVPEVIDCWAEAASMPFAELHYPFENKEQFKKRLPAQYISEYIAQTRTWFYYLHVLAVLLFDNVSFENVACTGTILNDKGEKLSKSKKNFTDPWLIIEQYGMDALRFYLMSTPLMQAEDLFFKDQEVKEIHNKVLNTLRNVSEFYHMYAGTGNQNLENVISTQALDIWIMSKLHAFVEGAASELDQYNTVKYCRLIKDFIEDLSLWYVRRSRKRFHESFEKRDEAVATLHNVLLTTAKVIAPVMPFFAEDIYRQLRTDAMPESVHLCDWPENKGKGYNPALEQQMDEVRKVVTLALGSRAAQAIKVRQPLATLTVKSKTLDVKNNGELLDLIKDEVNVKEIVFDDTIEGEIVLNTDITPELREEGVIRDIVRFIQDQRKEKGLKPEDKISVLVAGESGLAAVIQKHQELLLKEVRAKEILFDQEDLDAKELVVDDQKLSLSIKKI